MSSPCFIPSNPDISGIGVRVAIYLQNLLCFIPAIWAIWDGKVSDYELESAETQSTNNLVLAFAILISCIVQALTLGLTTYHATIVLSLSWMNNTNAFIYFLLYVQYKGQEGLGHVEPQWCAWVRHIKSQVRSVLYLTTDAQHAQEERPAEVGDGDVASDLRREGQGRKSGAKVLLKRIAILLGSLHLTLLAALGIWLWSEPRFFGTFDSSCAVEFAEFAVLGARVPFGSNSLRIFSLALYGLFLLPGLNLLLPMVGFLGLYFWHHARRRNMMGSTEVPSGWATSQRPSLLRRPLEAYAWCIQSSIFPICVGLGVLFAVNALVIADIEMTLYRNKGLQDKEEAKWGFGQILAILLVLVPVRDIIETILARRLRRQARQELQIKEREMAAAWKGAVVRRTPIRSLSL